MDRAAAWYDACREQGDETVLQAGARRFALRVGRALATALACEHAQWAWDRDGDRRPTDAVRYLARAGRAGAHRLKAGPTRRLALDLAADGEAA
jgi:hypothetical protein